MICTGHMLLKSKHNILTNITIFNELLLDSVRNLNVSFKIIIKSHMKVSFNIKENLKYPSIFERCKHYRMVKVVNVNVYVMLALLSRGKQIIYCSPGS